MFRCLNRDWENGNLFEIKKYILEKVTNRNAETYRRILSKYILPGNVVITDCWRAYKLEGLGFAAHYKINHSKFFCRSN